MLGHALAHAFTKCVRYMGLKWLLFSTSPLLDMKHMISYEFQCEVVATFLMIFGACMNV